MKEVCCDFRIEPQLIPIANVNAVSGNIANLGRLDYQVLEYGDQWKIIYRRKSFIQMRPHTKPKIYGKFIEPRTAEKESLQ